MGGIRGKRVQIPPAPSVIDMSKSKTHAVRRERRKSELLLKQGLIREPQRGVGHHIVSSATRHAIVVPTNLTRKQEKKARKQEQIVSPLRVSLQEFYLAFERLHDKVNEENTLRVRP